VSLENARVVVIGGSGGIGSAVVRRIRSQGGHPILMGRSAERLAVLGTELGVQTCPVDAANSDELERAVASFTPVNGIVNCAGSILLKPAHLTAQQEWEQTIRTNLTTAFATVKAAVKTFGSDGGSIVLCATAAARTGIPNHEAIAAAKAGVIGLTLSAAATYAPRNVRVNCVAPGLVDTPLAARITSNETARKASAAMHALGRIGRPDEVASGIVWFLDPENAWVTGQVLGIDGGLGSLRSR
jgi:NAD(P)-dependent dehydrogenase (short-subunit alcohol dehydrogenase family)